MEASHQSPVSPSAMAEQNQSNPKAPNFLSQEPKITEESKPMIGYLEVLIHQAREIHNICIYHKQDVYAKLSLTTGGNSISTKTINGGGRNPVFNETLRIGVETLESSLRCEIWMLSRVKNYLQDQLLGLSLIPLSEIISATDPKSVKEYSLSSNDLFHSPAGFVQLSIAYTGSSPEVIAIPPPTPKPKISPEQSTQAAVELEKIEFPDMDLVKENQIMVSEYFGIPCSAMDTTPQSSESLISTEDRDSPKDHEAGVRVVESFSTENSADSITVSGGNNGAFRNDTPPSSISTTDSPVLQSISKKDKGSENFTESEVEADSSGLVKPLISIKLEQEQTVDQKEIMDMYMKSMLQFTESLAKMKLPMDIENNNNNDDNRNNNNNNDNSKGSGNSSENSSESGNNYSGRGAENNKNNNANGKDKSRVFYGSRAFF